MKNIDLSLVIACYCEEPHLFANIKTLHAFLSATRFSFEMIFVEDKSPDETAREVIRSVDYLRAHGVPTKTIFHEKNFGRGRSVQDGFEIAEGEVVGFIDVDLEHLPDALVSMMLKIRDRRADAVVARRIYRSLAMPHRTVLSLAYKTLVHAFIELPVSDSEAGFKLFRREKLMPVLENVRDPGWFWDTEIVHQAYLGGLRFAEHPIVFEKNPNKMSTVRAVRDSIVYFARLITYWRALRKPQLAPATPQVQQRVV